MAFSVVLHSMLLKTPSLPLMFSICTTHLFTRFYWCPSPKPSFSFLLSPSSISLSHPISPFLTTSLIVPHRLTFLLTTVTIRFQPIGSAPHLKQRVFKISASQRFETVVNFLRKKLDCKPRDSVFLYVNSTFAPALDEGVGNLFRVSLRNIPRLSCLWL